MNRIPVITVCDRIPHEDYFCHREFKESLRRFGNEAIILGKGEPWHGLMDKPKRYLSYMRSILSEHVILTDAWDVIFLESPVSIIDRFLQFNKPIVFSAERTMFPGKDYGNYPTGPTDVCYLNSGFIVGVREALISLFEHMDVSNAPQDVRHEDGKWTNVVDQERFHFAFVEQFVPMTLDYASDLCQSMFKTKPGEIELGARCRNTITGAYPMALHWNGPAKTEAPILPAEGLKWWRAKG